MNNAEYEIRSAADELDRVVKSEVDDCQRALKAGKPDVARREIDEIERKLKQIAARLRSIRA
jgi:hypothetical protein